MSLPWFRNTRLQSLCHSSMSFTSAFFDFCLWAKCSVVVLFGNSDNTVSDCKGSNASVFTSIVQRYIGNQHHLLYPVIVRLYVDRIADARSSEAMLLHTPKEASATARWNACRACWLIRSIRPTTLETMPRSTTRCMPPWAKVIGNFGRNG